MDLNLRKKKALITGGSKGIGLAIKKALEAEGVECISWSRSEGTDLMKKIPKMFNVDFVIHNVGGGGTWKQEDYEDIMKKNYFILASLINNLAYSVTRVITISSIYGKEAGFSEAFTAAKAAEIAYMKSCSRKYAGITFNTISPGYINTKTEIKEEAKLNDAPVGIPEDIARMVVFLCSPQSNFINGTNIVIDGGYTKSF